MRDARRCEVDPSCGARPPEGPKAPDPLEPDALAAHGESRGRCGARKVKALLARSGKVASRRRICRIMRESGLASAYGRKGFKAHPGKPSEADLPSIVARGRGGRAPRARACSDPACVRVGGSWNYACLLADPCNRETVGHSAGARKDAGLVKAAFATVGFPISDIEASRADRGPGFDNAQAGELLGAFGIERSLSRRGCPYDNAVGESTSKVSKAEPVCREPLSDTRDLQAKLSDYARWHDRSRLHSTLGYMSPVEFREAGLSL